MQATIEKKIAFLTKRFKYYINTKFTDTIKKCFNEENYSDTKNPTKTRFKGKITFNRKGKIKSIHIYLFTITNQSSRLQQQKKN